MNTKNQFNEPKYATRNGATIKTVNLQVAVTEPNLKNAVRTAFDLAKSGGRELNLTFGLQPPTQGNPKPSDIRAAHFTLQRAGC